MVIHNCSSKSLKVVVFVLAAIIYGLIPGTVRASCGGRPSAKDLGTVADHVVEVVAERYYWIDFGSIPHEPAKLIFGVSLTPIADFDGANVIAIVPEIDEAFFWSVCGNEFVLKESLGVDKNSLERLETGQYKSFFDPVGGSRRVEMTVQFSVLPHFGALDPWKDRMLGKIGSNLGCFFFQNPESLRHHTSLTMRIGDFSQRSLAVWVAIPELDDLWSLTFHLDPDGVPDGIGHTHEERLSAAKATLRARLSQHSFVRSVPLRCSDN